MTTTVSSHNIQAYLGNTSLPVETATITIDESWAPYAQASITIAMPNAATLDLLDPRDDVRIQLLITQDYGTSETLAEITSQYGGSNPVSTLTSAWGGTGKFIYKITAQYYNAYNNFGVREGSRRVFDLTLRERKINHVDGTVELSLSSDEALLQDYALVSTTPLSATSTNVRTTVQNVLARIGRQLEPGTLDGTFTADAGIWEPGQTAWDYLQPLVQAASLRLYCDEKRKWYLVADQAETAGSINLSYTGTMTDASDIISRDSEEWYDAVVIKYTYVDGSGNTVNAYDAASSAGYSKVLSLTYDTAKPAAGQAARILQRAQGRGRVNEIRAISDYLATPGMVATIAMPDTDSQIGNLAAITWNFPSDEMSVKTRGLLEVSPYAWLYQPLGRRWNSIAAGVKWNTYTP